MNLEKELRKRHADSHGRVERSAAIAEAICLVDANRADMEQAVISAASSIIDAWDDWDAEASQAAQQEQSDLVWMHVMMEHLVARLHREFGWS